MPADQAPEVLQPAQPPAEQSATVPVETPAASPVSEPNQTATREAQKGKPKSKRQRRRERHNEAALASERVFAESQKRQNGLVRFIRSYFEPVIGLIRTERIVAAMRRNGVSVATHEFAVAAARGVRLRGSELSRGAGAIGSAREQLQRVAGGEISPEGPTETQRRVGQLLYEHVVLPILNDKSLSEEQIQQKLQELAKEHPELKEIMDSGNVSDLIAGCRAVAGELGKMRDAGILTQGDKKEEAFVRTMLLGEGHRVGRAQVARLGLSLAQYARNPAIFITVGLLFGTTPVGWAAIGIGALSMMLVHWGRLRTERVIRGAERARGILKATTPTPENANLLQRLFSGMNVNWEEYFTRLDAGKKRGAGSAGALMFGAVLNRTIVSTATTAALGGLGYAAGGELHDLLGGGHAPQEHLPPSHVTTGGRDESVHPVVLDLQHPASAGTHGVTVHDVLARGHTPTETRWQQAWEWQKQAEREMTSSDNPLEKLVKAAGDEFAVVGNMIHGPNGGPDTTHATHAAEGAQPPQGTETIPIPGHPGDTITLPQGWEFGHTGGQSPTSLYDSQGHLVATDFSDNNGTVNFELHLPGDKLEHVHLDGTGTPHEVAGQPIDSNVNNHFTGVDTHGNTLPSDNGNAPGTEAYGMTDSTDGNTITIETYGNIGAQTNALEITIGGHHIIILGGDEGNGQHIWHFTPGSQAKDVHIIVDGKEEVITQDQACQLLGITHGHLQDWANSGNPPGASSDFDYNIGQNVLGGNVLFGHVSGINNDGHPVDFLQLGQIRGHAGLPAEPPSIPHTETSYGYSNFTNTQQYQDYLNSLAKQQGGGGPRPVHHGGGGLPGWVIPVGAGALAAEQAAGIPFGYLRERRGNEFWQTDARFGKWGIAATIGGNLLGFYALGRLTHRETKPSGTGGAGPTPNGGNPPAQPTPGSSPGEAKGQPAGTPSQLDSALPAESGKERDKRQKAVRDTVRPLRGGLNREVNQLAGEVVRQVGIQGRGAGAEAIESQLLADGVIPEEIDGLQGQINTIVEGYKAGTIKRADAARQITQLINQARNRAIVRRATTNPDGSADYEGAINTAHFLGVEVPAPTGDRVVDTEALRSKIFESINSNPATRPTPQQLEEALRKSDPQQRRIALMRLLAINNIPEKAAAQAAGKDGLDTGNGVNVSDGQAREDLAIWAVENGFSIAETREIFKGIDPTTPLNQVGARVKTAAETARKSAIQKAVNEATSLSTQKAQDLQEEFGTDPAQAMIAEGLRPAEVRVALADDDPIRMLEEPRLMASLRRANLREDQLKALAGHYGEDVYVKGDREATIRNIATKMHDQGIKASYLKESVDEAIKIKPKNEGVRARDIIRLIEAPRIAVALESVDNDQLKILAIKFGLTVPDGEDPSVTRKNLAREMAKLGLKGEKVENLISDFADAHNGTMPDATEAYKLLQEPALIEAFTTATIGASDEVVKEIARLYAVNPVYKADGRTLDRNATLAEIARKAASQGLAPSKVLAARGESITKTNGNFEAGAFMKSLTKWRIEGMLGLELNNEQVVELARLLGITDAQNAADARIKIAELMQNLPPERVDQLSIRLHDRPTKNAAGTAETLRPYYMEAMIRTHLPLLGIRTPEQIEEFTKRLLGIDGVKTEEELARIFTLMGLTPSVFDKNAKELENVNPNGTPILSIVEKYKLPLMTAVIGLLPGDKQTQLAGPNYFNLPAGQDATPGNLASKAIIDNRNVYDVFLAVRRNGTAEQIMENIKHPESLRREDEQARARQASAIPPANVPAPATPAATPQPPAAPAQEEVRAEAEDLVAARNILFEFKKDENPETVNALAVAIRGFYQNLPSNLPEGEELENLIKQGTDSLAAAIGGQLSADQISKLREWVIDMINNKRSEGSPQTPPNAS